MSVDLNIITQRLNGMVTDLGRALMHQVYPKDFEYYMMALELVNGSGDTIDYLAFPIMPSQITKSENKRIAIKKAYRSTLVLTSTAFTPQDIQLRGNFGRNFKILVGNKELLNGVAFINSIKNGQFELNQMINRSIETPTPQFSHFVKTGYGAIKLLQSIIHKSDGSDQTGPFRLYLYNYALGESYLVVAPTKFLTLEQNDGSSNMMWNYMLNLTIVAPMEMIKSAVGPSSNRLLLEAGVVQSGVNKVGRDISSFVSRVIQS